jgi:hypothetical protein
LTLPFPITPPRLPDPCRSRERGRPCSIPILPLPMIDLHLLLSTLRSGITFSILPIKRAWDKSTRSLFRSCSQGFDRRGSGVFYASRVDAQAMPLERIMTGDFAPGLELSIKGIVGVTYCNQCLTFLKFTPRSYQNRFANGNSLSSGDASDLLCTVIGCWIWRKVIPLQLQLTY